MPAAVPPGQGSSSAAAAVPGQGTTDGSDFEPGTLVWVPSTDAVWASGKVTQSSPEQVTVALDILEGDGDGERTVVVPASAKGGLRILRRNMALLGSGALRFDDLTEVPDLHEAAVLHALDVRFVNGRIYTLTGPVLLAVNPFRTLPGLYSPSMLRSFVGGEKLQPHIFSVANHAYQGIVQRQQSQTVLVSGESGAGKTETTKFVMQFLALAGAEAVITDAAKPLSRVERQVLRSNPLLEAFGNAKTLRNENSSRFGKYIELQFGADEAGSASMKVEEAARQRLVGTRIHTYLLEKVRVIHQQEGERSFHIFYQVLAAATQAALEAGGGKEEASSEGWEPDLGDLAGYTPASFAYLRRSSSVVLEQADDARDFEATLGAMRTVGFSLTEVSDVVRALAAVLHLGDITFAVPAKNSEASEVVTKELGEEHPGPKVPFETTARLLGVEQAELHGVLCFRSMQAPGEGVIRMANSVKQAVECRDALARHLYHAVFSHIVEQTNRSIGFREEALFCGVLDIFGFEFFQTNSFEQLCINFTNELLQQYFNTFIFENETQLYRDEGIHWDALDFPDNAAIVTMLSQAPSGVFPMLDEECFVVGGTSATWHTKLVRAHDKHSHFSFLRHLQGTFVIRHFAGPVTYNTDRFLEKNKDRLTGDLLRCLSESSWLFLRERFCERSKSLSPVSGGGSPTAAGGKPRVALGRSVSDDNPPSWCSNAPQEQVAAKEGSKPPRRSMPDSLGRSVSDLPGRVSSGTLGRASTRVLKAQRLTVSSEFRQQLQELMAQIHTTAPHFVRCIKPNPKNRPFVDASAAEPRPWLDRLSVAEQLRYQGVLEAIRVARAGYPVRFLHQEFFADFRCLVRAGPARSQLEEELATTGGAGPEVVRKLLESSEVSSLLQEPCQGSHEWAIGKTRVFLKQGPFGALRAAQARARQAGAVCLQAAWRGCKGRRGAAVRWRALVALQAHFRGFAARKRAAFSRRERAATAIEAACRTLLAQHRVALANVAVVAGQRWARMRPCRKRYLACLAGVVRAQAWWRGWLRRRRMRMLPILVLRIQTCWRGSLSRRRTKELRADTFRLRKAVRALVRIRRKNLAYRRWRSKMLEMYRGPRQPQPKQEQLMKHYLELEDEHARRAAEVQQLRAEVQRLEWKVQQAKSGGFLTTLARFCM